MYDATESQGIKDRAALDLLKHLMKVAYAMDKSSVSIMDLNSVLIVAEGKAIDTNMKEVEVI